jgi:hypothetical protein
MGRELGAEIQANFNNSHSFTFGFGEYLNAILVGGNHPHISTVPKAEPSPDWFLDFTTFVLLLTVRPISSINPLRSMAFKNRSRSSL